MSEGATVVYGVDVHESARLLESGEAVLIDVREENEWAAERIPGALLHPLSRFADNPPPAAPDKVAIFHCRSGRRTHDWFALFERIPYRRVVHMEGGILDWKAQGYPTEN